NLYCRLKELNEPTLPHLLAGRYSWRAQDRLHVQFTDHLAQRYVFRARFREILEILQSGSRIPPPMLRAFCGTLVWKPLAMGRGVHGCMSRSHPCAPQDIAGGRSRPFPGPLGARDPIRPEADRLADPRTDRRHGLAVIRSSSGARGFSPAAELRPSPGVATGRCSRK